MPAIKKSSKKSLFERLNSLHKLLICFGIALLVYLVIQIKHLDVLTHLMIGWNTFSLCMIVMSWITFSITTSQQIRELAKAQDSSRVIIFIIVLISTFASFLAVVLLLLAKKDYKSTETFHLIIAILRNDSLVGFNPYNFYAYAMPIFFMVIMKRSRKPMLPGWNFQVTKNLTILILLIFLLSLE